MSIIFEKFFSAAIHYNAKEKYFSAVNFFVISAALKNERQNDSRSKEKPATVRDVEEVKRAVETAAQRPERGEDQQPKS